MIIDRETEVHGYKFWCQSFSHVEEVIKISDTVIMVKGMKAKKPTQHSKVYIHAFCVTTDYTRDATEPMWVQCGEAKKGRNKHRPGDVYRACIYNFGQPGFYEFAEATVPTIEKAERWLIYMLGCTEFDR